jgi:hypothetical protein
LYVFVIPLKATYVPKVLIDVDTLTNCSPTPAAVLDPALRIGTTHCTKILLEVAEGVIVADIPVFAKEVDVVVVAVEKYEITTCKTFPPTPLAR